MKRIFVRSISLILCVAMAAGMSGCTGLRGNVKDNQTTVESSERISESESVTGSTVQTTTTESSESKNDRYKDYIFVGDSRSVGMDKAIKEQTDIEVEIVAKNGQGLKWLKETAPSLYGNKGKTIIFNLGVNDLKNVAKYAEFYNKMPKDFIENNTLIFMTVNPVDEAVRPEWHKRKNSNIELFNKEMKEKLDERFRIIDSYTYLKKSKDFKTTDGLHYTNSVYLMVFNYAIKCCENKKFARVLKEDAVLECEVT